MCGCLYVNDSLCFSTTQSQQQGIRDINIPNSVNTAQMTKTKKSNSSFCQYVPISSWVALAYMCLMILTQTQFVPLNKLLLNFLSFPFFGVNSYDYYSIQSPKIHICMYTSIGVNTKQSTLILNSNPSPLTLTLAR